MHKPMYVYILTNRNNTVLYTGVTNNLQRRVFEHRHGIKSIFAAKYRAHKLVHYEVFSDPTSAIAREKQIKAGPRRKKLELIRSTNPNWDDLYDQVSLRGALLSDEATSPKG